MLRIKDRGLFRGKSEEIGVKLFEPVQHGGCGHIVGLAQLGRAFACGQQVCLVQHPDRFHAARKVGPIGRDIRSPRQMRRHADDGDVIFTDDRKIQTLTHPSSLLFHPMENPREKLAQFTPKPAHLLPRRPRRRDIPHNRDNPWILPEYGPVMAKNAAVSLPMPGTSAA